MRTISDQDRSVREQADQMIQAVFEAGQLAWERSGDRPELVLLVEHNLWSAMYAMRGINLGPQWRVEVPPPPTTTAEIVAERAGHRRSKLVLHDMPGGPVLVLPSPALDHRTWMVLQGTGYSGAGRVVTRP